MEYVIQHEPRPFSYLTDKALQAKKKYITILHPSRIDAYSL